MFLAQLNTPARPDLPEGPSLERVRGPVEIPPYEPWQIAFLAVLALCLMVVLIWGIAALIRARKRRRPPIAPHAAALAEIDAAATHTHGDDERFTVLISLALRRYFENGHAIPSLGRTTEEFLRSLETHPLLDTEASASLAQCMTLCDRVKFARQSLQSAEREKLSREARALILQVHERKEAAQP